MGSDIIERYRIFSDVSLCFVTFSIVEWLPIFVSSETCDVVTGSLNYCHDRKHLRIHAYVVMPTHIHAIVSDENYDPRRLTSTLTDFRKYTGRQLADYAAQHLPSCFAEVFRQSAGEDRERRCWQPTRHPVSLETEAFWLQKLNYLHDNPRRKGLVRRPADWRYSSAAFYVSDGREPCDVKLTRVVW